MRRFLVRQHPFTSKSSWRRFDWLPCSARPLFRYFSTSVHVDTSTSVGINNFDDDDYQGLLFLHDMNPPDEDFKQLWGRVERYQRFVAVVDVLKEWERGGRPLSKKLVDAVLLKVVSRMWFKEARKLSSWMFRHFTPTEHDELLYLEIARRSESRKAYEEVRYKFRRLQKTSEQAYVIYLEACISGHLIAEAEHVMDELRRSGLIKTVLPYNVMLKFYLRCGRTDEALALYKELVASGIPLNLGTYSILMRFKELFSSEQVEAKAEAVLECMKVDPENRRAMLRLYGYLGKKEGVEAVWIDTRAHPPVRTTDYLSALEAFDLLGEVKRAEHVANELELKTNGGGLYPLVSMLRIYARHGWMDEAKQKLRWMDLNGWQLDNRSVYHLVQGYLKNQDLDEALKQFQEGWRRLQCPTRADRLIVETMVKLFEACADIQTALSLIELVPASSDVKLYKALISLSLKTNKPVFGIRRMIEDAKVIVDEECKQLLEQLDRILVVH